MNKNKLKEKKEKEIKAKAPKVTLNQILRYFYKYQFLKVVFVVKLI